MPVEFPERFNMADYFLYHNLEEGRENRVCLYFKDQSYTYGEAARMSNRAGNALRDSGVDALELSTGADLVDTVMRFADLRKRKRVVRAHDVPVA